MASYKYDTLAQKDVIWVGKDNAYKVSVSLSQESSDYFGNGDYSPTRDGLRIRTVTYINGVEESALSWVNKLAKPQGDIVAAIGRIGLTAERAAEIAAAEAEVKKHPAWQAKIEKESKSDKEAYEYERHSKAVDDMMTLGGKTY